MKSYNTVPSGRSSTSTGGIKTIRYLTLQNMHVILMLVVAMYVLSSPSSLCMAFMIKQETISSRTISSSDLPLTSPRHISSLISLVINKYNFRTAMESSSDDTNENTSTTNYPEKDDNKSNHVYDCLVLGGGISGSTLAHNLYVSGIDNILLAEARDYLGGNVKSHQTSDGFIWEEGPNSFATQPSIVRIAHELNIDDQLVFANEALPPWVYHNGKLHPLPKGKGGRGAKGQLELLFGPNGVINFALRSELLSWPGKIRAGIGSFLGHMKADENKEETIQDFILRTLGEEVFLRCVDPFVSGVYAGNPATLGMKAALPKIARIEDISYGIAWNKFGALFYGGILRQIELTKERKADPPKPEWVEFEYGNPGSFRYGLSTLPNAIYKELNHDKKNPKIQLSWKVIKVEKLNNEFITTFDTPNGIKQSIRSKVVVSTMPTHALKGIFTTLGSEIDDVCTAIRDNISRVGIFYPPVAAVTVAYPKSSFQDVELPNEFGNLQNLPGFGSLNPRTEKIRTLGTLWSSSLFPDRCPDDYNLLLNYIGGSRDVSIADLTPEEIIQEVDNGCRKVLLKPDAPKPKLIGMKLWPTAIPQYELGHRKLVSKIESLEKKISGLYICGNYRTGVAFPDCVTFGYEHAKIVKDYLQSQSSSSTKSDGVYDSSQTKEIMAPTALAETR